MRNGKRAKLSKRCRREREQDHAGIGRAKKGKTTREEFGGAGLNHCHINGSKRKGDADNP